MCYGPEKVANVDVTGPFWAFCASSPVVGFFQFGGYGRSESWFAWGADGAVEDVRIDCEPEGEFSVTGERDKLGRMVTYRDGSFGGERRLAYGDDDLPDSAVSTRSDGSLSSTKAFAYDVAGVRLLGTYYELVYPELTEQVDVAYDGDLISSVQIRSTGYTECDQTVELVRDAGRIVEISQPGCSNGVFYYATLEWDGDVLVRSTEENRVGTTEARYTYADGRLSYVEEDRDGEPLTTSWYEYDAQGRLEHLVYWGHQMPEPE